MEFRILRLRYENIRDFGKVELSLVKENDEPHGISLLQMPNGTGKTTTLQLLQKTLAGTFPSEHDVANYKPIGYPSDTGRFEVDCRADDNDFTLRLNLDYVTGRCDFQCSKPSVSRGGLEDGHWLPDPLKNVFKEQYVKLFVFDGELSKKLLNPTETAAENAIRANFFLDRLGAQVPLIDLVKEQKREAAGTESNVRTDQGLRGLKTKIRTATERLQDLTALARQLEAEKAGHEDKLRDREHRKTTLIAAQDDLRERQQQATQRIEKAQANLKESTMEVLRRLRVPSQFSSAARQSLVRLESQMKALKLPKAVSVEFFKEISRGDVCICGRPLDEETRKTIEIRSESFLTEDDIGILNGIKAHLAELPPHEPIENVLQHVHAVRSELLSAQQALDAIAGDLNPKEQAEAEALQNEIDDLKHKIRDCDDALGPIILEDSRQIKDLRLKWEDNIRLCREQKERLEEQAQEISGTVEFEKKAKLLQAAIARIVDEGLNALKADIINRTNKRIDTILKVPDVRISSINKSLKLSKKEAVSEGQTLSVGYAFLSTLFEGGAHDLPFVVDSPAGGLDLSVRREVARMVPSLFSQWIVFITSGERNGFIEGLESSHKDIQYLTAQKDVAQPGVVQLHVDRDFFMEFQSEDDRVVVR